MKYFGYMPNDFINGEGVCVSLWTAGCPHHCFGCHNEHMWNYENGYEIPQNLNEQLIKAISDNGIIRNFSVLGGEPLAEYNINFVDSIIKIVKEKYPDIKIFLWTGYTIEELVEKNNKTINSILNNINTLIDGRYIQQERDITLKLRGSRNQHIINMEDWKNANTN